MKTDWVVAKLVCLHLYYPDYAPGNIFDFKLRSIHLTNQMLARAQGAIPTVQREKKKSENA